MFNLWFYFVLYSISAANISANLSTIHVLTGINFKSWKENVMIVLGCMDLDLALRKDQPLALTEESSTEDKRNFELWEKVQSYECHDHEALYSRSHAGLFAKRGKC